MRKIAVIARREYRAVVRSKAFLITLVLMPVLMLAGSLAPKLLEGRIDLEDKVLVVADASGFILPQLEKEAQARNASEIIDPETGRQTQSRILVQPAATATLDDGQRLALSARIRQREISTFAEIDRDLLKTSPGQDSPVRIYEENILAGDVSRWFRRVVDQSVQRERLRAENLDPAVVARATAPVSISTLGLFARDKDGSVASGDSESRGATAIAPLVIVMLLFLVLMMSQTMLQSTLEEKQQKIAEVLLGSVRPMPLMVGKLVGNAGAALTTLAIYLAGGVAVARQLGHADVVRYDVLGWVLVFAVLGVGVFGSIFLAVGAACSDLKETQSYLLPVMLVLMTPMFVLTVVLIEPMSGFATGMSLIPLWTPMLMPMRLAATEAVPLWQPLLGALGTLLAALAALWAGGRIFRIGLLSQGKAPKPMELLRWILRG